MDDESGLCTGCARTLSEIGGWGGMMVGTIVIEKERTHYEMVIDKDDFADALTLAEEDAKKRKLLKSGCSMVEGCGARDRPVE